MRDRKHSERGLFLFIAAILALTPALSCGMGHSEDERLNRPDRPTGSLVVGLSTVAASQVMEPDGGVLRVSKAGDPLDGMVIDVPPGAHESAVQYNVSSAAVVEHSFGKYFNPATPLITVENGGDYSDEFITMRIPVEVPPDHFAMAFYYDADRGSLEGIPFKSIESDAITIVTRHFSGLLVSVIKNSLLDDLMKGDIDSLFRPGIDDWQFTNYGSYIAPGGHCAGQCLSALWYFCEQPDGEDLTLNGRYDRNGKKPATPELWQDDSYGYRLASTVHADIDWGSFANNLMYNLAGVNDDLTYKAFAYAIQLTGEPQEIGIYSSAGGGHDMICYRVHKNSLYIADPNYPGVTDRRINFVNGRFEPYNSGANAQEIAAGNGKAYETIQYCAKSATVDWKLIGQRWAEFKAGTIGDDRFPGYQVYTDEEGVKPLYDGFTTESDRLRIVVDGGDVPLAIAVYINGERVTAGADRQYALEEGDNVVGIAVYGNRGSEGGSERWEYIDFKYYTVTSGEKDRRKGWTLVSVTPEWEMREKKYGDEYQKDDVFDAWDGGFHASGRYWIGKETDHRHWEHHWILFTHDGSWSPLPEYIPKDAPAMVTLNLSSPALGVEGEDVPENPGGVLGASLSLMINPGDGGVEVLGVVDTVSTPAKGETLTLDVEFNISEYSFLYEGMTSDVAIWFGTVNGGGCYRYRYVYHE